MPTTLLMGAGYVGEACADFLSARGDRVVACTASPDSAKTLGVAKAYRVHACDVSDFSAVSALREREGDFESVIFCASSSRGGPERYHAVFLNGARNLTAVFSKARMIFTGSTSVYAQRDGSWVDETSPTEPDREAGRTLRMAEEVVLGAGGMVARLAGIYGPGRSVLLRRFLAGEAVLEGDGLRWLNHAHRDDIVSALATLQSLPATAPHAVFNVCDDRPLTQLECYHWLAGHFGRPLPPAAPPDYTRKRGWTNKRVSNARLRSIGWHPRFACFLDAIKEGMDPGPAESGKAPSDSA